MHAPSPSPTNPPPRWRSGNPMGNPLLNQSPRCGARTRAGCPCRAPALRGKRRCRRHGGLSTGPRTAEGLARIRSARTVHGYFSAAQRARDRHMISSLRRTRMLIQVMHWLNDLPPALAARALEAPELYLTPEPTGGMTLEQDRAILRQEKAALAPWRAAVEAAKRAWREEKGKAHVPVSDGSAVGLRLGRSYRNEGEPCVPGSPTADTQADAQARAAALGSDLGGDDGGGAAGLYQNAGEPHVPVSPALSIRAAETDVRRMGGEPRVPVSGTVGAGAGVSPRAAALDSRLRGDDDGGEAGDDGARGPGLYQNVGGPNVPISLGLGIRTAETDTRQAEGEPCVPVRGAPPAGMTRAQRKRWKWEQRKARKLAARNGVQGDWCDKSP